MEVDKWENGNRSVKDAESNILLLSGITERAKQI